MNLLGAIWVGLLTLPGPSALETGAAPEKAPEASGTSESVRVELRFEGAVYKGEDLIVKLRVRNGGEEPVLLPPSDLSLEAFVLTDSKGRPPDKISPGAAPREGLRVDPYQRLDHPINLSAWYPRLTMKLETWRIAWEGSRWKSEPLEVRVIKAYNPKRDREVLIETEAGPMSWELLPEHAPNRVKRFVDLARQGYYDGLPLFRAIPGLMIEGGDPKGDGTGGWENVMHSEFSENLPVTAGLVGSIRGETSMTSDSMFFILISSGAQHMRGMHTFFARVKTGWNTIGNIISSPTRGNTTMSDAFLLLDPVLIERVEIK